MFNLKTHHALKLLVYLAAHVDDGRHTIDQLAEETGISRSFLGKIVQLLAKKRYLRTKKGPSGGVALRRPPEEISIVDVLDDLGELDPGPAPDKPCCTIEQIDRCIMEEFIANFVANVIEDKTLKDLSERMVDPSS